MDSKDYFYIRFLMNNGATRGYQFPNFDEWSKVQSDLMDTLEPPLWLGFTVIDSEETKNVYLRTADIQGIEATGEAPEGLPDDSAINF